MPELLNSEAGLKKAVLFLFATAALLAAADVTAFHLGERYWQLERTFALGREANIPTWFASALFLMAAMTAAECGRFDRRFQLPWGVLAVFLAFLSCDEVAMLHENFAGVIRRHGLNDSMRGYLGQHFPATSWPLIFGFPIAVTVFWLGGRLKERILACRAANIRLISGVLLFFLGSAGVELMLNAMSKETPRWIVRFQTVMEETLEMTGIILFLWGLWVFRDFLRSKTESV